MGCFLCPPGHPSYKFQFKDGARGYASVEYVAKQNQDLAAKKVAQQLLDTAKLEMTEEWIRQVYHHYYSCYRKSDEKGYVIDGERFVIDGKNELPPETHCGFLFVKKYFPHATPRLDLIKKI